MKTRLPSIMRRACVFGCLSTAFSLPASVLQPGGPIEAEACARCLALNSAQGCCTNMLRRRLFSLPGRLGQADEEGRKARPDSGSACYACALLAGQFGLASQEGAEAEQEEEGARSPCVFLIDKQPFVSAPSKHAELGPLTISQ